MLGSDPAFPCCRSLVPAAASLGTNDPYGRKKGCTGREGTRIRRLEDEILKS